MLKIHKIQRNYRVIFLIVLWSERKSPSSSRENSCLGSVAFFGSKPFETFTQFIVVFSAYFCIVMEEASPEFDYDDNFRLVQCSDCHKMIQSAQDLMMIGGAYSPRANCFLFFFGGEGVPHD